MALYPLWWVGGGRKKKKPHFSVEVNKTYSLRALVKPRHTWGRKMKPCPDSRPLFLLGNQSIKLQGRERERNYSPKAMVETPCSWERDQESVLSPAWLRERGRNTAEGHSLKPQVPGPV